MTLFTETETLLAVLGILATSDVTGFEQLHRLFLQRTQHLHELPSKTLSEMIEEMSVEGWIPSVPHPRMSGQRILRFQVTPAGRAYLSRELLQNLKEQLVKSRLEGGESAILKRIQALNKVRSILRVLQCEDGVSAIQALEKRWDEAHPS